MGCSLCFSCAAVLWEPAHAPCTQGSHTTFVSAGYVKHPDTILTPLGPAPPVPRVFPLVHPIRTNSKRVKFVGITFVGEDVGGMQRGRVGAHSGPVKMMFGVRSASCTCNMPSFSATTHVRVMTPMGVV